MSDPINNKKIVPRPKGPQQLITRFPPEGRSLTGGLRIGCDCHIRYDFINDINKYPNKT